MPGSAGLDRTVLKASRIFRMSWARSCQSLRPRNGSFSDEKGSDAHSGNEDTAKGRGQPRVAIGYNNSRWKRLPGSPTSS